MENLHSAEITFWHFAYIRKQIPDYGEYQKSGGIYMKVYVLVYEENSDYKCGSVNSLWLSLEQAKERMKVCYTESLVKNPIQDQDDDYYCEIGEMAASIIDGEDSFIWRIEENTDLDVEAIIHVEGGMVQDVLANADISVTVFDMDTDDPEQKEEVKGMQKRLEEVQANPMWRSRI